MAGGPAALLADAGTPTVLFGVDGAGAHASTEWVGVGSLHDTARAVERAITAWTGMTGAENDARERSEH